MKPTHVSYVIKNASVATPHVSNIISTCCMRKVINNTHTCNCLVDRTTTNTYLGSHWHTYRNIDVDIYTGRAKGLFWSQTYLGYLVVCSAETQHTHSWHSLRVAQRITFDMFCSKPSLLLRPFIYYCTPSNSFLIDNWSLTAIHTS